MIPVSRVCDLLDYTAEELTGKSMYSLVHTSDVDKIKQTHIDRKWSLALISDDNFPFQ